MKPIIFPAKASVGVLEYLLNNGRDCVIASPPSVDDQISILIDTDHGQPDLPEAVCFDKSLTISKAQEIVRHWLGSLVASSFDHGLPSFTYVKHCESSGNSAAEKEEGLL